ncbi:MFS general substrate transporter [Aspergillus terreus]|uniref:MFS general substrate transporter n=1 Tax=Aspergillus terreus TaxID=33178 RepID=A0A5M3YPV1_ASPTE|nr:hypothetical protein ATETN484_0001033000 [Aspergillus terreus]GFF12186.1 MFS general substrate transporter [Aspergillus terreus]
MAVQNDNLPQSASPAELPLQELRQEEIECEDNSTVCADGRPQNERQLLLEADELVTQYALDDIRNQIRKAALLIDDPDNLDRVAGLTEEETDALQGKSKKRSCCSRFLFRRWGLPTYLCHVGGVLFSSAELFAMGNFVAYVGKAEISPTRMAIWFGIKFLGFWLALPSNRYLGRRRTLCAAAATMTPASYGANPDAIPALGYIAVSLFAAAVGVFQCTVAPYLAELSPAPNRGAVVSSWILNQTISILFIFNTFTVVSLLGIGIGTLLTTSCLLLVCWFTAESPYTSVGKGNAQEAYETLCRARKYKILAACDLYRILSFTQTSPPKSPFLPSRATLRAAASLAIVVTAQIIPRILIEFMQLHLDLGYSGIILILLITLFVGVRPISLPVLDLLRRRRLVLAAMLVTPVIVFIECIGLQAKSWALVACAHLLLLLPIAVQTLLPVVYAAEVFPLEFRDVGMAVGASLLFASEMAARWLIVRLKVAPTNGEFSGTYYSLTALVCFGAVQIVLTIFVYLVMRETAGQALEDMGAVFETRTRDLVRYRLRIHLPYMFRRYILWKDVDLCPFEMSQYGSKPVRGDDMEA